MMSSVTTDDIFQEWIEHQNWICWRDPSSVRKAFILFGDYLIEQWEEHKKQDK